MKKLRNASNMGHFFAHRRGYTQHRNENAYRNMAKLRQFLLLIWKNFKLQWRHPWITLLELGVPAIFSLCLVLVRSFISSNYVTDPTLYEPFNINGLPANLTPSSGQWEIIYAPESVFLDKIVNNAASKLNVLYRGFNDEDSMLAFVTNTTNDILSGIVFDHTLEDGPYNSTNIKYKIRPGKPESGNTVFQNTIPKWQTQYTFPIFPALGPRNRFLGWGGSPGYMSKGFLSIQHALATSFMEIFANESDKKLDVDIEMCRYPYPPFLDDNFILSLQSFFPMIICFSFIYPAVNIVKNIVVEKEKKLKESMKMMGLSKWLHWIAWFIKYFLFLILSCSVMTVLLCVKFTKDLAVINATDPSVILIWLIVYTASIICFCFFLSTLFSKANSATSFAGIIFFLTFTPYFFIMPRYNTMSRAAKMLCCLVPNLAIAMGSIILAFSEASGAGLQWDNISEPATPDDTLTLSMTLMMYFIDSIICLLLTWYIEAVFPGEYGVPEHWYFPFTRSYWCGQNQNLSDMVEFYNSEIKQSEYFEKDPVDLMAGIQVHGLTKVYGKRNSPAVNNISINMYRSHITVLLGHNGAGKTTTISMLTGLITPTSGTAMVNGYDICEEMDSVHSNLGICPQHDVLFDELTVEEHLYFFCKLKGYISDLVPSEIDRIISILNMEEKRYTKAEALSGGWKRRLSVGIALVGGSRIVILDEPTSGMDPFNRRSLWNVLQAEKEDRTILLTTHFMEEADVLGDRIAIMADGEVQCCGSPLFLKKKYGAGYHLVMVKEPSCDVSAVTNLIQLYVPNAEMLSNIGTELKYLLPHDSSHLFPNLFSEIEKRKNELMISGYGASITTMEEVFIKVGHKTSQQTDENSEIPGDLVAAKESTSSGDSGIHVIAADNDSSTEIDLQSVDYQNEERNTGLQLFLQHLEALLKKRILHTVRNWTLTIPQLILPPFFLIITLLMLKTLPKPEDAPPLLLSIDSFHGSLVPYDVNMNFNETRALGNFFSSQFTGLNKPYQINSTKQNLTSYLLEVAAEDLGRYNLHNMVAAKFDFNGPKNKTLITTLFNNQAYHSPAIALLEVHNAILKFLSNNAYSFKVINHPLPRSLEDKGQEQQTDMTESYQIAQDIMFGMSFLVASFAVFIIKERASGSKHLQRVSGGNLFSYWFASFLWDLLNYLIPCCLVLVVFIAFGTEGFSSAAGQGRLFVVFLVHGLSILPFVYCCTFLFMSPSTAYVRICLFTILAGIATLLTVTILEIPGIGVKSVAKILDFIFSILIPNYDLGRAVANLYQNHQFNKFCNNHDVQLICRYHLPLEAFKPCCKDDCGSTCIPWEENYFAIASPGIGKQLIFFAIQAVLFTYILVLCERNFIRYLRYKIKGHKITPTSIPTLSESIEVENIEDDDVRAERLKIQSIALPDLFLCNHLVIREVTKQFGNFTAVNKLSFGVRKGECFGLLGLNGAGKTSTFKMITGDTSITSGEIYVDSFDVKKESRKVQKRIGYCPQFDGLIDQLTGRETLTLFSCLRGIPKHLIADQVNSLSELLSFQIHIDKQVKDYSGGNKRKLSTAIALLGNAPVIFLDEPTTGMDPVSRRCLWNALLQVVQAGRSVVLTTHSMEECEALCSRLVIMVNGRLCCLGSPQHLKSKFGEGFTLVIKIGQRVLGEMNPLKSTVRSGDGSSGHYQSGFVDTMNTLKRDMDDVRAFVDRTFESATLKSAHENLLLYHIPRSHLSWSEIFRLMENAKSMFNIEDYSVGETSLEQVFVNFAMGQR
ncbi:phospholipid-transporting ATPase ABCA3-like isoform X2 [Argiope bruennichi]|uniref:phospholipid-transporting ATPase ABCA3-like isoform X2 n=1 Tax=Argiope bruennichi TaxID=94029 RepID=UPI002495539C|nr:phospholipid-transporting ATPase ABCA3-like isoform X2 [Argiope bruennichi]